MEETNRKDNGGRKKKQDRRTNDVERKGNIYGIEKSEKKGQKIRHTNASTHTHTHTHTHTGKMEIYQQNDLMNMLQPDTTHRLRLRPSSCYKF